MLTNSGTLEKTGFVFSGWNTQADGNGTHYDSSGYDSLIISANVILYSEWAEDSDGDSVSDEDETDAGTDPGDPNDKPRKGTIIVTVYQQDGSPAVGYICILNSTPVVITTDSEGVAVFTDVDLAPHTLKLLSGTVQLGTYSLYFTKDSTNTIDITDDASTDSDGSVQITVNRTFLSLDMTIQQNAGLFWQIQDVDYTRAENPQTGDNYNHIDKLWIFVLAVLTCACVAGYIAVKHNNLNIRA